MIRNLRQLDSVKHSNKELPMVGGRNRTSTRPSDQWDACPDLYSVDNSDPWATRLLFPYPI